MRPPTIERIYPGTPNSITRRRLRRQDERRMQRRWTMICALLAGVGVLLALAAAVLAWSGLIAAALPPLRGLLPLAVLPLSDGMVAVGCVALALGVCAWLAHRDWRSVDAVYEGFLDRQGVVPQDPFAGAMDGLDGAEMTRILISVAAEGREIRRLVDHALRTLTGDDAEDALEIASHRLLTLIACVEALSERLNPCITEKEGAR